METQKDLTSKRLMRKGGVKREEKIGKITENEDEVLWHTVRVEGDDVNEINWVRKKHLNLRMTKKSAMDQTEGDLKLALEKFKTIGTKLREAMPMH